VKRFKAAMQAEPHGGPAHRMHCTSYCCDAAESQQSSKRLRETTGLRAQMTGLRAQTTAAHQVGVTNPRSLNSKRSFMAHFPAQYP
jgi:hypothetical protein